MMVFIVIYTLTAAVALWSIWKLDQAIGELAEMRQWWLESINGLAVARDDIDHLQSENRALRLRLQHQGFEIIDRPQPPRPLTIRK